MKKGYFKASLAFLVAGFLAKGDWSGFQELSDFHSWNILLGFPVLYSQKLFVLVLFQIQIKLLRLRVLNPSCKFQIQRCQHSRCCHLLWGFKDPNKRSGSQTSSIWIWIRFWIWMEWIELWIDFLRF